MCGMDNTAYIHLAQFDGLSINEASLLQEASETDPLLHIQVEAAAPLFLFLSVHFHVSGFQNSTLCKAPVCVCVSPFHPNDCNKREQMANFD